MYCFLHPVTHLIISLPIVPEMFDRFVHDVVFIDNMLDFRNCHLASSRGFERWTKDSFLYEYKSIFLQSDRNGYPFWVHYVKHYTSGTVGVHVKHSMIMIDPFVNDYVPDGNHAVSIYHMCGRYNTHRILYALLSRTDFEITSRSPEEYRSEMPNDGDFVYSYLHGAYYERVQVYVDILSTVLVPYGFTHDLVNITRQYVL